MIHVKRLILDVLKPHHPDVLEFAKTIAALALGYQVNLTVKEIDDKTETLELIVEGPNVDRKLIEAAIKEMGGSVHSLDGVEVINIAEKGH